MNNDNESNEMHEILFNEAPASWNTRYVSPEGFECQLTLRADTGQELLERVSGAISPKRCCMFDRNKKIWLHSFLSL
jgi:hypothetical protein